MRGSFIYMAMWYVFDVVDIDKSLLLCDNNCDNGKIICWGASDNMPWMFL